MSTRCYMQMMNHGILQIKKKKKKAMEWLLPDHLARIPQEGAPEVPRVRPDLRTHIVTSPLRYSDKHEGTGEADAASRYF